MTRKISIIIFILIALTMGMGACKDEPKNADPKCDCTNNVHNGACPAPCPGKGINPPCDCRDPNPCLCPDQANHLANGESKSCTGEPCKHTCTEQTAVITGTAIPITKATGVTVEQMDAAVAMINSVHNDELNPGQKALFLTKVSEVRIISGNTANFSAGVWSVGHNATYNAVADSLDDVLTAQLQPQTKSTFLADKGNKGREWVAKLMNDRIALVNDFRNVAYDKARGISI